MSLYNDCYPCILRQTLEAARNSGMNTAQEKELLHSVMRKLLDTENSTTSPEIAQQIHRHIRKFTGVPDPYAGEKYEHNRQAMEVLPGLREEVLRSERPLLTAARYAIAGNVIDFGASSNGQIDIHKEIESALGDPLGVDQFNLLQSELNRAEHVIYLGDNSGEIVFDRLLIETILDSYDVDITYVVRGEPVLNDVTMADARQVDMDQIVRVIDNGTDAPGTLLSQVPEDIRTEIESADLIIAKGQGNFESLIHVSLNIFFLFKVKCSVIARKIGAPLRSYVIASQVHLTEQVEQREHMSQESWMMDIQALQKLGYSDKAIQLLTNNVNHRDMEHPNYSISTESDCGDILILYFRTSSDLIKDMTFQYIGCRGLQAAASALTQLTIGKSFSEAMKIHPDMVIDFLQSIPAEKEECVIFSCKSLRLAVEKLQMGDTKLSLYPYRIETSDW